MKKISIFLLALLFFVACEDKKELHEKQSNEVIPTDVPISASETNITIDENFPPEPVIESHQNNK